MAQQEAVYFLFCLMQVVNHVAAAPLSPVQGPQFLWPPTIINNALETYVPHGSANSQCTVDGRIYEKHLQNSSLWAVEMVDASSKGPSGLLMGNNYNFGDFDECAKVHEPFFNIYGKYVVVKFGFRLHKKSINITAAPWKTSIGEYKYPPPESSAWEVFEDTDDRRVTDRNVIHWALCVPDSCSDDDIEKSLNETLAPVLAKQKLNISISVVKRFTYSSRQHVSSDSYALYMFLAVSMSLIGLVLVSTYNDFTAADDRSNLRPSIKKMSLIYNWEQLFKCKPQEFPSATGMKALSMMLIIFGHRMMISTFSPLFNQLENEMLVGNLMYTLVKNGALIVNTFLAITGFLTYYKILKDVNANKKINVFHYIYRRWMRLTPLYAYVMAITAIALPYLSHGGPLGRGVIFDSSCATSWWTQLLYINNYVEPTQQCLIPSWYLAADMQLYVVCTICGYVLWLHRKTGLTLLYVVTIVSILVPGVVIYQKSYNGVFLFYFEDFKTLLSSNEFVETYMYTHNRASPYIVGMLGGYLYYRIVTSKTKQWPMTLTWSLFMGALLVHTITWLGAWIFYIPDRPYKLYEHISYAILHRAVWAVSICTYIICENHGRLSVLACTIGNKLLQPISDLSYAALLIHTPLQLVLAGLLRSPPYYNLTISIWMASGDIVLSYFAALLLYLFVEAPLTVLRDIDFSILSLK
ncbi:nose resistant to fluoxetine protein 6-like [Nesidiocoris tenuis]|uniref:Nose resistant to fluoxetine protein 6-like n=1 Tax=Nesidiocoris tenuis TaxID=355587 RepID=A0ABN7ADA5_9HEMI|nr:nose resistant to fluoxetine protein 6-like [Nesidiocoris tenuis]